MVMAEAVRDSGSEAEAVQAGVPDGYNQTEIGLVPSDWQFKPLGEVISLKRGHDLTARQRGQGDVPVMGSAGQNGFHDVALVEGPGVVLGRSGASYGQAHYCHTSFWPHNTALYVTDFRGSDPLFVFYFLRSIDFSRHNSGGAQQSLNRNFIYPIPVSVPHASEQKIISQVISDADALIESLEIIIEKKRLIKQGAMQELLSGRRRLPGYGGEWTKVPLGTVAEVSTGNRNNQDKVSNGRYPFFVRSRHVESINCYSFDTEAILIPGEGDIGKIFHYIDGKFDVHQRVYAIRNFSAIVHPRYVYCFLKEHFGPHAMKNTVKATVDSLRLPTFLSFKVALPPTYDEQRAIASALFDMESELENLEAKLEKARQVKQGLMQELLTGRVRLV